MNSAPPDQAKDYLDDTKNRICTDPKKRLAQLTTITERGLQRMDEKKLVYYIAGHKFVLQDQIAQASKFVQWGKTLVDEAVKCSPEASMAWCGICLILPLLTLSSDTEQAHRDGFTYVTARMRFYVQLEPLFPKNQDSSAAVPEDFIVDLYQHLLEFQFRSVLRFFRSRLRNLGKDLIQHEDWKGMLEKVQALEGTLDVDLGKINNVVVKEELKKLNKSTKKSLETLQRLLSVAEDQLLVAKQHLDIAQESLELQKYNLPIEDSALYDSAEDQHIPRCQEGTRKGILSKITVWANAVESETIFWLHGPAGTGKSTISRTIARDFAEARLLGASYFFKRQSRSGSSRFFPTIAARLVDSIPPLETHVCQSLNKLGKLGKAKIEEKSLETQFQTLILTPCNILSKQWAAKRTRVIVIDALDECEADDDIRKICTLLSQLQELNTVRVRVLLTSRSTSTIGEAFNDAKTKHTTRDLSLLDFSDDSKTDISAFLGKRFAAIKNEKHITENPWPDPKDLAHLLTLATNPSPLFIYAATLCLFVNDGTDNPKFQLKLWLDQSDNNNSQLSQTYQPILNRLLFVSKEGEEPKPISNRAKTELRQILGAIILLATPLSVVALGALLNIDPDDVNIWLRNLHAVLNISRGPEAPVNILHKSFSDFLLGTGMDRFRVDAAETHAMLASRCIDRMKREDGGLRKDMCNLRDYGKLRDKIEGTIIQKFIVPDLKYACLNWVYHLQHCRQDIRNEDEIGHHITDEDIYDFLRDHFLHWLEALSLIGVMPECDALIGTLQSLIAASHLVKPYLYL